METAAADHPIVILDGGGGEEEEDVVIAAPYGVGSGGALSEELDIQEAILLSLDSGCSRRRSVDDEVEITRVVTKGDASTCSCSSSCFARISTLHSDKEPEVYADRKGKRKLKSEEGPGDSKRRKGRRSSHQRLEELARSGFVCGICMETLSFCERFAVKSCVHSFCNNCVGRYIAAKVAENVVFIRCPDPGCEDGLLELEMCRDIIPQELCKRWGDALCESVLGSKAFYCPFKDCSVLLIDEGENGGRKKITNSECPHCHRMFCAQCRVPWHVGFNCKEFQKLEKDERGTEDLMLKKLAKKSRWQRCPTCKMYVERIDGCLMMKCRCGYYFCYNCASPMSKDVHYCRYCKH